MVLARVPVWLGFVPVTPTTRVMRGVVKIPSNIRTEGTNGGKRHGDAGVALFNFHAASRSNYVPSEYEPIGIERIGSSMASF